jgi:hypothetical protein
VAVAVVITVGRRALVRVGAATTACAIMLAVGQRLPGRGSRNGIPLLWALHSTPARTLIWQADHASDGGRVADLVWSAWQIAGPFD